MLISDIFQQNQQIAQRPTTVIRTPQQVAYDNLLNREDEINRQNKRNNFVSGLMTGIGGLGKIIANSAVSQPMLKAGAMRGIGEQETRLDGLRQAYDKARQQQNQDYVAQAKEQLGLAREDENTDYAKQLKEQERADALNQQNIINALNQDKFDLQKSIQDYAQKDADAKLKILQDNAKTDRDYKQAMIDKMKYETSPEYLKAIEDAEIRKANLSANKEEQKNVAEQKKDIAQAQAKLKAFEEQIPELERLNEESSMGGIKKGAYKTIDFLSQKTGIGNEGNFISDALAKDKEKVRMLKDYVFSMMKSIYGGNVSETERDVLLENFGLLGNLSPREFKSSLNSLLNRFRKDVKEKQYSLDFMQDTQDYQIMEDANGNKAKVYKDGRIEEI